MVGFGAGVMPFCDSPSGERFLVLGREEAPWASKNTAKRWSAFSGGAAAGEDVEEAAAREFIEESMGCVPVTEGAREATYAEVLALLRARRYVARLMFVQPKGAECFLFLLRVPWDPHHVQRFAALRAMTDAIDARVGATHVLSRAADAAPWRHPSVLMDSNGVLSTARAWCEKSLLGLWGLPRLRAVVRANGVSGGEYFRPLFMPQLNVALQLLGGQGLACDHGVVRLMPWK